MIGRWLILGENLSFIKSKSFYVKIIIFILVIILIIFFVKFFVPIGITVLEADGKGVYVDQSRPYTVMIGTDGNGYIRSEDFDNIPGTDKPEQYKKLINNPFRNMDNDSFFLKIYDGGNAERMHASYSRGTIITNNGDLYIFSNKFGEFKEYITPVLFKHNIQDAFITDSTIYVIDNNDELGYYKVSDKDNFIPICKNVRSFQLDEFSEFGMLVLTNDNVLYVYSKSDNEYKKVKLLEDVRSFSLSQGTFGQGYSMVMDYNMLGVVKTDGTAQYVVRDTISIFTKYGTEPLKLADFQQAEFTQVSEKAVDIAPYFGGVAVLLENGDVYVTGAEEPGNLDFEFNNVLIAKNIKSIESDAFHLLTLDNDGTLTCYGKNPDQTHNKFVPLSDDK